MLELLGKVPIQPASAAGALDAYEVSWIGTHLRADSPAYLPPARPTRTLLTSLTTTRRLGPRQMSLCCLSLGWPPSSLCLGTGDARESRRRAGGSAIADYHRKEEVQHHRDDNDRTYFDLKQESA